MFALYTVVENKFFAWLVMTHWFMWYLPHLVAFKSQNSLKIVVTNSMLSWYWYCVSTNIVVDHIVFSCYISFYVYYCYKVIYYKLIKKSQTYVSMFRINSYNISSNIKCIFCSNRQCTDDFYGTQWLGLNSLRSLVLFLKEATCVRTIKYLLKIKLVL